MKWLLSIIHKYNIDLIIPGIEADMYAWIKNKNILEGTGCKTVLNNEALISLCADKLFFYEALIKELPQYSIFTFFENNYDNVVATIGDNFLIKPRSGHGSKGIIRNPSRQQFNAIVSSIAEDYIIQPIIGSDDEEYSSSLFGDGKGGFYCSMTLQRKLSKDGYTEKASVYSSQLLLQTLKELCAFFKPLGPTNFQFRKDKGVYKLLEINPRISSATSIRAKFGYNESGMAVNYFLNDIEPNQPIIKKGRAIRYIEDLIIYEKDCDNI